MENKKAKIKKQETVSVVKQDKIERKYNKTKTKCKVTFFVPGDLAPEAQQVAVAGTFNNWDQNSHLLTKMDSGDFSLVVELDSGNDYEFRYVIDGRWWENTMNADRYIWSEFGNCENMIVSV